LVNNRVLPAEGVDPKQLNANHRSQEETAFPLLQAYVTLRQILEETLGK